MKNKNGSRKLCEHLSTANSAKTSRRLALGISPFNARFTPLFALLLMVAALVSQLHASNLPGSYGVTAYWPWSDVNLLYDSSTGTVAVFTSPNNYGRVPMTSANWSTTCEAQLRWLLAAQVPRDIRNPLPVGWCRSAHRAAVAWSLRHGEHDAVS